MTLSRTLRMNELTLMSYWDGQLTAKEATEMTALYLGLRSRYDRNRKSA